MSWVARGACHRGRERGVAIVVAGMLGCSGNFNASGSGNATFVITRNGREDARYRVNVVFTSRRANHASGGFLDLKISNVPCPLLLDGDSNVVSGRVCPIADRAWVISGGAVVGASLTLTGYPFENPGTPPPQFTLTYPEVVEAGVDDVATFDASGSPDVATADVPVRAVDCFSLCRSLTACGSGIQTFCENECDSLRRVMGGRCEALLSDLQRCTASSRVFCGGGSSALQRFSDCSFEYNNVVRCGQGF